MSGATAHIAGFSVTVLGWERPESEDAFDGDWLLVEAACETDSSKARSKGATLFASDFARFFKEVSAMDQDGAEQAVLAGLETDVRLELARTGSLGAVSVKAEIAAYRERHNYDWEVDLSYLPALRRELSDIVLQFPSKA